MRPIDADELYTRLMKRYLMHNMKDNRLDMAARAAIWSCMEAVERSKTVSADPPPNDPLPPKELRKMDGEPAWNDTIKQWTIVDTHDRRTINVCGRWRPFSDRYYRRKPEEGTQ